jgi:hypothetical protein
MSEIYIQQPYEGAMAKCDQCGELWAWDDQEVIHDVQERLTAGCETPSGECPDDDCRALCFLVKRVDVMRRWSDVLPNPDDMGAAEYREIYELIAANPPGMALTIARQFESHACWIAKELEGH